jgi:hypothetical protein
MNKDFSLTANVERFSAGNAGAPEMIELASLSP